MRFLFKIFVSLQALLFFSCKEKIDCNEINCAPCIPDDAIALFFDTSEMHGFSIQELDSTKIIKIRASDNTYIDTTFILKQRIISYRIYNIRLQNPGLKLDKSEFDYLILQKDSLFSFKLSSIQYKNYPPTGGCCDCFDDFKAKSLQVNDSFSNFNYVLIKR